MDKKKIPTRVGMTVIVIVAITVSVLVWKYEKDNGQIISQMPNIFPQQNQNEETQGAGNNQPIENIKTTKSYKNGSYGYEIEIPDNFDIKTGSLKDPESLINIISKNGNKPLFVIDVEISKFNNINSWLNDYRKKLRQTTSYEGVKINPPSILSEEKTNIDGAEAIKVTLQNMPYSYYSTVFIKDKFIYTISYNGLLLANEEELIKNDSDNQINLRSEFQSQHKMELDKIINSFKFIR